MLDICARSWSKMRSEPSEGAIEAGNQVQQRGFAGPGRPQQADELPLFDGEGHAVQRADDRGAHR